MKIVKLVLVLIFVGGAYLALWPIPIDPQPWAAPTPPGLTGKFAVNEKLSDYQFLSLGEDQGPEAVIENSQGDIYTVSHDGWVLRWPSGQDEVQRWVNVGGRPLGIAFDAQQNLWVANSYTGLQKITPEGDVTTELDSINGSPILFADDLDITPDGKIYFSDATTKFGAAGYGGTLEASFLDLIEHGDHGRVIEFDPQSKQAKIVMQDMTFPNGVAAATDGSFILVTETGSYRVWKHWLSGPNAGQSEVIIENLPGFPDNVHIGKQGRFWVGLATIRAPILDQLSDKPFWRKVLLRLPSFLHPKAELFGHVFAIDGEGNVLHSLQDPSGKYPTTTGAWESDDYLYVSSLTAPNLARIDKNQLGL